MKQREIKFRVFDKDGDMRYGVWPIGNTVYDPNGGFWLHDTQAVMQYTGLKDKNGKEIYEGDIIRFKVNFPGQKYDDGVVRWADGGWWTSQHEEDLEETLSDELRDLEGTVIGNIYENPELKP